MKDAKQNCKGKNTMQKQTKKCKKMQGQKHNAKKTNEQCKKTSAETQRKTMQIKNAENAGAHQKSGRQNGKKTSLDAT